jgi:protein TonB
VPTYAAHGASLRAPTLPPSRWPGAPIAWLRNPENRPRIVSGLSVAMVHALLFYMLINGFGGRIVATVGERLKLIDIVELPPPPPAKPAPPRKGNTHKARTPNPEGAASPKNLRDTPVEIVAPPPQLDLPPPLPAAPAAGEGRVTAAGAADTPGPGTGSGGIGAGTGSGEYGSGTGGGGGGMAVHARWIAGRIKDSDYPAAALDAGASGTVYLRFIVQPNGRVTDCRITRSSGRADLDITTCRLIEGRFRYRPARDVTGRPIAEMIRGEQHWETSRREPEVIEEPDDPGY